PSIASFTASKTLVDAGDTVDLTAVFDGVDAVVTPGDLPITSGAPLAVSPTADTTYSLVVVGGDGTLATAEASVAVFDFSLVVTSTADAGPGTLREALETAAAPTLRTSIAFSVTLPATITLASDLPAVVGTVQIAGPGVPTDVTIDGDSVHRVLFVDG